MRWVSHIAIGGATAAVINPMLVPAAVLGATAPDWMEWIYQLITGRNIPHRGPTHYLVFWIAGIAIGVFLFDWNGILTAFCWGGLSHVLADSLTITGVPVGPWSDRRVHLFGGRLRTGEPAEYAVVGGIVGLCIGLSILLGESGWSPFFYQWHELYSDGVIDGSEWRANRFRLL